MLITHRFYRLTVPVACKYHARSLLRIYSDNCIGLVYNLASIPAATFASS